MGIARRRKELWRRLQESFRITFFISHLSEALIIPADVERPSFGLTCPGDIKRYADKGKNYTEVTWSPVEATDNSGMPPNVTSSGVESRYYNGKHEVVYNATDEAGNYKICKFHVIVEG